MLRIETMSDNKIKQLASKPFTSKEDVANYFSGNKIQCLICGKWFCTLATHIVKMHRVTVDDYKEMYGLPWGHGLVADDTRKKSADSLKRRINEGEKALMKTPEERRCLVEKAAAAKERPKKSYDIERIVNAGRRFNSEKTVETVRKAEEIISVMEREKLPACTICSQPGQPGIHIIYRAFITKPELRERYEKAKMALPRGVEVKLAMTKTEIKNAVLALRELKLTTREIAKELCLGATTVKRILREKGANDGNE
jgi:hypothetical protein